MPRGGQVSTCVRAAVAQSAAPCCCRRFLLGCRVNAASQLGAAVLVLCEQPVVCIVGWKLVWHPSPGEREPVGTEKPQEEGL